MSVVARERRVEQYVARNPDATFAEILGRFRLDPTDGGEERALVESILDRDTDGDSPDTPRESSAEGGTADAKGGCEAEESSSTDAPDSARERARFGDRLDEASVRTARFIDVRNGEKGTRSRGHQQPENWHAADDPALSGNYGVHPGSGLIEFDIDDYDRETDRTALDALPPTFTVESPHTASDDPGHRYYAVADDDDVRGVLRDVTGTLNPEPSWGEIKYEGKYVVGPGSQLDGCTKEWCDDCSDRDGGYYRIAEDRPIATLDAGQVGDVLRADSAFQSDGSERGEQSSVPEAAYGGFVVGDERGGDRDEWPTCYRAALAAREAGHGNDGHKINVYAAEIGLTLFGRRTVLDHFCESAPPGGFDRETTEYQLQHIEDDYSPPALSTLATAGVLPESECDPDCPIHGAENSHSKNGSVEPIPTVPFAMLSRPRDELVRYARKRGLDWPETDEARDRLGEALRETFRDEGYAVLDAPTGLGKTHEASATFWRQVDEEITGGRPVVLFASTTDARDEAKHMAREAGLDVKMLLGYKEACEVAGGAFDPENVDEDDDREPRYIDGIPAGQWFETHVEDKGIAVSSAHSKAERLAEQGYVATAKEASANGRGDAVLPCCPEELKCPTETQWPSDGWTDDDGVPRYDLVVATDPFAYVPGLRANTNVIHDEQPDYTVKFGESDEAHQQRIQRAVTAFLKAADAPREADTFAGLIQTAEHGFTPNNLGKPIDQRRKELDDALHADLPRDWFFEHEDAHTRAPALARTIYYAAMNDVDENGRRSATTPHEPPRLDAGTHEDDGWNRTWVTVVLDDEDGVATVRDAPDFSTTRSVVGLDAWPNPYLWQRNVHPSMTRERVLDPEERSLWRRFEQGKTVVGVGDATRPAGSDGEYFTVAHADAIVSQLRAEFGEDFQAAGCASAVEDRMRELLAENGIDLPDDPDRDFTDEAREAGLDGGTMHYGEEKSRNDLAEYAVGLVYGCIDPGDDYVLDLAAECDLDVRPARHECPKCEGEGCGVGDPDCLDGTRRTHGREFVGEDGEDGAALLASVRENHVAQMTGRFGRGEDVEQSVVFVATDATPPGLVDYQVPGVLWLARPNQKQRALVEYLRANPSSTAREASDAVDCSKEHARQVFAALVEQGKATVADRDGDHGADVYRWLSGASASATPFASVDLAPEDLDAGGDGETTNSHVWSSYTWQLAIPADEPASTMPDAPSSVGRASPSGSQTSLGGFGGVDPPPERSD